MRTVLTGARLTGGDGEGTFTITVEGDRITAVDPSSAGTGEPADGAGLIDLDGRFVLPGMTSAHVHAEYRDLDLVNPYDNRETRSGVLMAIAVATARTMVESGFTGFVGAGCSNDIDVQLDAAIRAGIVQGPRMVLGSGYGSYGQGADVARKVVDELIDRGADIIKVFATDGHGAPEGRDGGIGREELAAIVETAHGRGKRVRAHCVYREKILDAVEVGVDLIDHGDELDERAIELMAALGTFWVPSAHYLRVLTRSAPGEAPPSEVEASRRYLARMGEVLAMADEAGVRILLGDDYGIRIMPHRPGMYAAEMVTYLELGCRPEDILRWATVNGAEVLGLADRAGVIEAGRLADLVVVDGDPLDDLGLLADPVRNVPVVMKGGDVVKNSLTAGAR